MSKGFASNYRIVLVAAGLIACFAGLGTRLVWLHVVDRDSLVGSIVRDRGQVIVDEAKRGEILDSNGVVLATSRTSIVVGVDPSQLVETEKEMQKWPRLAELIGMPEPELRRIFSTKFRAPAPATPASAASTAATSANLVFNLNPTVASSDDEEDSDTESTPNAQGGRAIRWVKLADDISEVTSAEIAKLGLRGVYEPGRSYRRVYPNNQLAAHILGYVDRHQRPAAGIEFYEDFYLRGQNGWRVGERDARGRELAQFRTRDVPRANGYNVKLSIDATVQDIIEQELAVIAQKYQPLKATIIVSDPRSGFILGMANYPTFNLNEYNKVPADEMARMKNVAVTDVYEPGSVFKIVAASAALEDRLVTPDTTFDCTLEKIDFKGRTLKLPRDDHHFDHDLSVAEIISHSSNRGAAQLAMKVGQERFYGYARAFGFGQKLGFPIGGEVSGIFAKPEKWYPIDITRIPMGQSIAATALQMHQAMSTIASGGMLLRPQIISKISDASGEAVLRFDRVELGRAISEQTAKTMARLLTGVASKEGTAPEAAIAGYEVAGKTGTSQKYIDGKPSDTHHVASFVGFFPASRPQVAISVIVDDADAHTPNGVAYGAKVAAPSFRNIGEKLITVLNIKSDSQPGGFTFTAAGEGGRR